MNIETLSERLYQSDQGYEITQIHKFTHKLSGSRVYVSRVHVLRVIAHQGNLRYYAYAKAERWDGNQWHEVAYLNGYELPEGPGYVCWRHDDRPHNNRDDCEAWLVASASEALKAAVLVLDNAG